MELCCSSPRALEATAVAARLPIVHEWTEQRLPGDRARLVGIVTDCARRERTH